MLSITLSAPGGDLVGRQEQQVDIRLRGHLGASVAAHGEHGDAFGRGGLGRVQRLASASAATITQSVSQV